MAPKLKTKTLNLAELAQDEPDIADLSQAYHDAGYQDNRGRRDGGGYGNDFGARRGYGEGYGGRRHEEGTSGDDGPWRREGNDRSYGDRSSYGDRPSYGGDRQSHGDRPAYRGGDDFQRGGRGGDDMGRRPRDEPGEEDVATTWRTSGVTRKRDAAPMGRESSMGMVARPSRAMETSEGSEDNWRRGKPAVAMAHTDSAGSLGGGAPVKRKFNFASAVGHLPEAAPASIVVKAESQPSSESVTKAETGGYRAAAMREEPAPIAKPAGRFAGLDDSSEVRPARRVDSDMPVLRRADPSRPSRFDGVNDPLPTRVENRSKAVVEAPALARTDGPKKSDGVVLAPMTMGSGKPKKDLLSAPKVAESAFQRNQMRTDAATAALLHEDKKEKKLKKVNERKRAMMAARASGHNPSKQFTRDPVCYKNHLVGSVKNLEILAAHFETVFERDAPATEEDVSAFVSGLPAMLEQAEGVSGELIVLSTLLASLIKEVMTVCEETIDTMKLGSDEVSNEQLESITDKFLIPAVANAARKADVYLQELARSSTLETDFPYIAMQTLARLLAKAEGPRVSASLNFAEAILIGLVQSTSLFTSEVILDWVDDREDDCEGRAGALAQILHLSDALRGNLPAMEEDAQQVDVDDEDE